MAIIGISGKIGAGKDLVGSIIQFLTLTGTEKKLFGMDIHDFLSHEKGLASHHPIHKWRVKKFAYKLKQVTALLTGCRVEDLEDQEFKKQQLPEEWNYFMGFEKDSEGHIIFTRANPTEEAKKMLPFPNRIKPYTYREMLQRVGTEAMRNQIHENVWVNALFANYQGEFNQYHKDELSHRAYPNWIITDTRFPNEAKAIKERNGILIRVERDYVLRNGPENPNKQHPSETALDNYNFDYTIVNDGTIEELVEKVKLILEREKII